MQNQKTQRREYTMPAEWARQEFVLLAFPHKNTDWAYMLEEVEECYRNIILTILNYENVVLICHDVEEVASKLEINKYCRENIDGFCVFKSPKGFKAVLVEIETNDTWCRDFGGITMFSTNKDEFGLRDKFVIDFTFNGWGMKFAANHDNMAMRKLFKTNALNKIFSQTYKYISGKKLILEGGSIDSDGAGTILSTEKCIFSDNRNHSNRIALEYRLKNKLNIDRILWLKNGFLEGDDTDSHVDTLARFCDRQTIAYVKCDDPQDIHYEELKAMEEELQGFTTLKDNPYKLLPLPMADAVFFDGERLPATYANFLIINDVVLVPSYRSPKKDEEARLVLEQAFPRQKVISIDCLPLIKQHGSLHCITMQFPK